MCGNQRVVEGINVEELFGSDEAQDGSGEAEDGRHKGREVDNIPLCAKCVGEISRDNKMDEEHLIPMALGRVDRFDGGLSRRRWEARRDAATAVPTHPLEETDDDARRPHSPIYVSLHDPMGASSFKASPTKPIPKWMEYLSSQRHPTHDQPENRPASILDPHFYRNGSTTPASDEEAEVNSPPPPPVPPHSTPVGPPVPTHTSPHIPRSTVSTYLPVQMSRPFTLITEEPVQRPSSAKALGAAGKQVRFTNIVPADSPEAGYRAKLPSESAEYLDRYNVRSPIDTRSSTVHVPSSLAGRAGIPTPLHRRGVIPNYGPTYTPSYASMSAASAVSGIREESGSSARTFDNAGYHKDRVYSGFDGYSHSPGSSIQGGEGSEGGRRRPLTFQDQLKRVFGFN